MSPVEPFPLIRMQKLPHILCGTGVKFLTCNCIWALEGPVLTL